MMEYAGQPLSHTGFRAGISAASPTSSGVPVAQHLAQVAHMNNAHHAGVVPQYPVQQQYAAIHPQPYPGVPAGSGGTVTRKPSAPHMYQNSAYPPHNMGAAQSTPQQPNGFIPQQYVRQPSGSGQFAPQHASHAGPSRTTPAQASQPPSTSHRQTSHSAPVPQLPQGTRTNPSAPPRSTSTSSVAPVAPAPRQTQAPASQQSASDPLPTPPLTAHPQAGGSRLITLEDASNMSAMHALKPIRDSLAEAMMATHKNFVGEFTRLHNLLMTSDNRFRAAFAHCSSLEKERARLTVERDAALKLVEQLKADKESAIEQMQKMNTNLPKLVSEYFELKSDHAELQQKMAMLQEENLQLREKAQANPMPTSPYESVFASPFSPVEQKVKVEKSPLVVKQERQNAPDSPMSNPDTAFAAELAQEHQQRKLRQRAADELQDILLQSESLELPPLPSIASMSYVPPTPISPLSSSFPADTTPTASSSTAPEGSSSSETTSLVVKAEQCETAVRFGIPDLGLLDLSGELSIIDLTQSDTSPMQLTSELPPLSRRVDDDVDMGRKRALTVEGNETEQPSKRQRTDAGTDMVQHPQDGADASMSDIQPTVDSAKTTAPTSTASDMRSAEGATAPSPAVPVGLLQEVSDTCSVTSPSTESRPPVEPLSDEPMNIEAKPTPDEVVSHPSTSASSAPTPPPPAPSQSAHRPRSVPSPLTIPRAPQPTPTQSPIVAGLSNLSLPSSSSTAQLPPPVVVKSQPAKTLGMAHLQLMYENRNDKLYCKVCLARSKQFNTAMTTYPDDAAWTALSSHYETEHPAACAKLVAMSPEQIREKKAEGESRKVPFPFVTKKRQTAP